MNLSEFLPLDCLITPKDIRITRQKTTSGGHLTIAINSVKLV
jgi:hypothetical protein